MSFAFGSGEVRVEPTASGKWKVVSNGTRSGRTMSHKKDAIKKGRKIARDQGGTLKVFNQDMSISEQRDYS